VLPGAWATTAEEAAAAVAAAGGPVAVKGVVSGVRHKGDAGLLRMPVTDPAEARRAVTEWTARAGEGWLGAVVQPMVPPGDELLVGAVRDASAGPVVALGPGGRAADALGHRMHRLAPLTDVDVEELLAGTGLFDTDHGRALDRAGVGDCAQRVGWLVDVLPEVTDVEVNPLVVTERGSVALDVRVRLRPAQGAPHR
jgi:succinyl-CoA synthetase beta subunit